MIARLLIAPLLEKRIEAIRLHLKGVNVNHPDVLYFKSGEKLGIAEAKKIKEYFSLKPYSEKGRTVVLEDASSLTIEAQNALLKTLEEPPKEALIILGIKSESDLLSTVLSRCQIIRVQGKGDRVQGTEYTQDIEKLLQFPVEERFEYIEKLKDKEQFLKDLTAYFHQNLRLHLKGVNLNFGKNLLQAEQWAKQNVNIRAILEYLMLVMPSKI